MSSTLSRASKFHDREILAGFPGEGLKRAIWDRFTLLLEAGVPSESILVLLESPTRSRWTALLKGESESHIQPAARKERLDSGFSRATGPQQIVTPAAWIKQELTTWWPLVEERLREWGFASPGVGYASARAVSVDLAQYLMVFFTRDYRAQGCFESARSPLFLQNVQLLDTLARGIENGHTLRDPESGAISAAGLAKRITDRLRAGLTEVGLLATDVMGAGPREADPALLDGVEGCLERYVDGMLRHRLLDFALQLELFASVLMDDPRYRKGRLSKLRHVLVENLDETSPRMQAILRTLHGEGAAIVATLQSQLPADHPSKLLGGLREYVGADPTGAWEWTSDWPSGSCDAPPPVLAELGGALYDGLVSGSESLIEWPSGLSNGLRGERRTRVSLERERIALRGFETHAEMLDAAIADLAALLAAGVAPEHLAFVAPAIDPLLIWGMRDRLSKLSLPGFPNGVPLYVFAGTNRLVDYRPVRVLITLARLCHDWGDPPDRFALIELLELVTGLPSLPLAKVIDRLCPDGRLGAPEQLELLGLEVPVEARMRYQRLLDWLAAVRTRPPAALADFFRRGFGEVYAPARATSWDAAADEAWQREVSQIGQLIELAERFYGVVSRLKPEAPEAWGRDLVRFLFGGAIAERPFFQREPHRASVMLSTASQLAEKGFARRDDELSILFVLDFGSDRWWKSDRRELTNSRVLSVRWNGRPYDKDMDDFQSNQKLGRVLRACCLKVTEQLRVYSSKTDAEGREYSDIDFGERLPELLDEILQGGPGATGGAHGA
jgi:hypothetical protein